MVEPSRSLLDLKKEDDPIPNSRTQCTLEGLSHGDQEPNPLLQPIFSRLSRDPHQLSETICSAETSASGTEDTRPLGTAESKENSDFSKYVSAHFSKHMKQKYLKEQADHGVDTVDSTTDAFFFQPDQPEDLTSYYGINNHISPIKSAMQDIPNINTFMTQQEDSDSQYDDNGGLTSGDRSIEADVASSRIAGLRREELNPKTVRIKNPTCTAVGAGRSGVRHAAHVTRPPSAAAAAYVTFPQISNNGINTKDGESRQHAARNEDVSHNAPPPSIGVAHTSAELHGESGSTESQQDHICLNIPKSDPYVSLTDINNWTPNQRYLSQINLENPANQTTVKKASEDGHLQAKWMEITKNIKFKPANYDQYASSADASRRNGVTSEQRTACQQRPCNDGRYKHAIHQEHSTKSERNYHAVISQVDGKNSNGRLYSKFSSNRSSPALVTVSTACPQIANPRAPSTQRHKRAVNNVHITQDEASNALLLTSSDVSEIDEASDTEEIIPHDDKTGEELVGMDVLGYACELISKTTPSSPRSNMRVELRLQLHHFREHLPNLHPRLDEAKKKMLPLFTEFRDIVACRLHQAEEILDVFCNLIKSMDQYFISANQTVQLYSTAANYSATLEDYVKTETLQQHRLYLRCNMSESIRSINRIVHIIASIMAEMTRKDTEEGIEAKYDCIIDQNFVYEIVNEINDIRGIKDPPPSSNQAVKTDMHGAALIDNPSMDKKKGIASVATVQHIKKSKLHRRRKQTMKKPSNYTPRSISRTPGIVPQASKDKKNIEKTSKSSVKDATNVTGKAKHSKVLFATPLKMNLPKIFTKFKSPKGTVYREQVRGANSSPSCTTKTGRNDEESKRKRTDTDSSEKPVMKLRCEKKTPSPFAQILVNGSSSDSATKWAIDISPEKTPLNKWYNMFERTPLGSNVKSTRGKSASTPPVTVIVDSEDESHASSSSNGHAKTSLKATPTKVRPNTCRTLKPSTAGKGKKISKKAKEEYFDVIDVAEWSKEIRPKNKRGLVEREDCMKILNLIYNDPRSEPFRSEVKSADVPDYHRVVKYSMCLDQVASKLRRQIYSDITQFVSDVRRIFWNCRLYNSHKTTTVRLLDRAVFEELELCIAVKNTFNEQLVSCFPQHNFSGITGSPPHNQSLCASDDKCTQKNTRISRELRSLMG